MSNDRKKHILLTAVRLSERDGIYNLVRDNLAVAAGCSTGLINSYFGTMNQLRRAIIRYAIQNEVLPIVAQAAVNKDPHLKANPDLIKRALQQAAE